MQTLAGLLPQGVLLLLLLLLPDLLPLMLTSMQHRPRGCEVGWHPRVPERCLQSGAVCARCLYCCLCWGASHLQKQLHVLLWTKAGLHLAAGLARAAASSAAVPAPNPSAGQG